MKRGAQMNKALSILILVAMVLSACAQATPVPTVPQAPTAVPTTRPTPIIQ